MIEETKKTGGVALHFNPDASPEEKAAQARSVGPRYCLEQTCTILTPIYQHLPSNFHHEHNPKAVGIATDIVCDPDGGWNPRKLIEIV